jgi:hypothetical protein
MPWSPLTSRAGLADPLITANIYCEGLLDELIQGAIAPFWSEVRRRDPERRAYLWLVRYGRGGEHLKLRAHAPRSLGPGIKDLLSSAVDRFLGSLEPAGAAREGRERVDLPPIDEEDAPGVAHPDRTWLWTRYRRSHVSLPAKPYLLDDGFLALFTACLGQAGERALDALGGAGAPVQVKARQTALLKGLISGLGALGWGVSEGASYLAYHRDWLIRFTLQRNGAEPAKARETLAYFDAQAGKTASTAERLRSLVVSNWTGRREPTPSDPWRGSLAALMAWVDPRREEPAYRIDPFAQDPAFPPVFKVLHGFANALGLTALDEAFTHHTLLQAAGGEEAAPPPQVMEGVALA